MRNYKKVYLFGDFYFNSSRNYSELDYELGIILLDLLCRLG